MLVKDESTETGHCHPSFARINGPCSSKTTYSPIIKGIDIEQKTIDTDSIYGERILHNSADGSKCNYGEVYVKTGHEEKHANTFIHRIHIKI